MRLAKVKGIFKRLKYGYPNQALLSIYYSLFVSRIHYGILLSGTNLETLFKLQKKTMRIITRNDYTSHTELIFKLLGLLKI